MGLFIGLISLFFFGFLSSFFPFLFFSWVWVLSFFVCSYLISVAFFHHLSWGFVCLFVCWFGSPFLSLFFSSVQLMASWCSSKGSSLNIQVQDVGPLEKSWPHGILISKSSPKGLHLSTKTRPHPKPVISRARRFTPSNWPNRNTTLPISRQVVQSHTKPTDIPKHTTRHSTAL